MPRTRRTLALAAAVLGLLGSGGAFAAGSGDAADGAALTATPAAQGLLRGRVTHGASPLTAARVYAYQLADLSLHRVDTDHEGRFLFEQLPAGIYKIIVHKSGFLPGVVLLTRRGASARQNLEFELIEERETDTAKAEDFWSVRAQIPPDILREMEQRDRMVAAVHGSRIHTTELPVRGQMQAVTGVDAPLSTGQAQVTGARVGLESDLRNLQIDFTGNFVNLEATSAEKRYASSGQATLMAIEVQDAGDSRLRVTSLDNRLDRPSGEVGYETHSVSWSRAAGEDSVSSLAATYTAQSNLYANRFGPVGLPQETRSWRVEGSYASSVSERMTMEAGFRYRDRAATYGARRFDGLALPEQQVDLFGRGGLEVKPTVLLEYGLYSTLDDGRVSLVPQGGVVLQLTENWRASASASQKVHDERAEDGIQDFTTAQFDDLRRCESTGDACYKLLFSKFNGEREKFTIGAVHRTFDETVRLSFNHDFFDHLEALYVVEGDNLPELQMSFTQRLSPRIVSRLESTFASGGGGRLTNARDFAFENEIQYLVTSVDTTFEATRTGVFVAFHRLEQALRPLNRPRPSEDHSLERLQVMLTQDLAMLDRLAADLAVQVNMELSRGTTPDANHDPDELRKRLTGGLAVKF